VGQIEARGVYQPPAQFIAGSFGGAPPAAQALWLTGAIKSGVHEILGHDLAVLRLRYWEKDGRSAWILDEIGKEEPITVGVVVSDAGIERVRVLEFRESRGDEVRHSFFTDQFTGARLAGDRLDKPIDGITGATLSVRALTKLARLALYLHAHRHDQDTTPP
jgi:hypothetical protein